MTIEESKKLAKLECALEFCKEQSVLEQYVSDEKWKHFDVAVSAIEKQIPKTPIKRNSVCYSKSVEGEEFYAYDYHCPLCGVKVNGEKHHCPCGQALDWNDI